MPTYKLKGITADAIGGEITNLDRMIEKSDFVHEFSVVALLNDKARMEKVKKELTAQQELEEAKMKNYTDNHPYILDLDGGQRNAISLYHVADGVREQCVSKLEEVEAVLKEYDEIVAEIKEQTGFDIYESSTTK